ncbi:hypothetical protein [Helicobacter bilis]|uniref:hypothetical protein n=1 Tax=Helicobacter bilis TaxID=37372 RepID=UPI000AD7106E|nr:hypothetical protein [Helicobacter bilis]
MTAWQVFFNCESDSTLADALEIAVDYDNMELLQAIIKGEIKLKKESIRGGAK